MSRAFLASLFAAVVLALVVLWHSGANFERSRVDARPRGLASGPAGAHDKDLGLVSDPGGTGSRRDSLNTQEAGPHGAQQDSLPSFQAYSRSDEMYRAPTLLRIRVLDARTGTLVRSPSLALNGVPLPECEVAPDGSSCIQHRISPGSLLSVAAPGCATESIRLQSTFWRRAPGGAGWETDVGVVLLGGATQVKVLGVATQENGRPSPTLFFVFDGRQETVVQRSSASASPGQDGSFLVALSGSDSGGVLAAVSSNGISVAPLRPRVFDAGQVVLIPVKMVDYDVRCTIAKDVGISTVDGTGFSALATDCTVNTWHDRAVESMIRWAERTIPDLRLHLGFVAEATPNGDPVRLRAIQSIAPGPPTNGGGDGGHRALLCRAVVEGHDLAGSLTLREIPSPILSSTVHQIALRPKRSEPLAPLQDSIEIAVLDKGTGMPVETPVTVTSQGRTGVMPGPRFLLELPQGMTGATVVAASGYVTQIARIDAGAREDGPTLVRLAQSSRTPVRVVDPSGQPIVGARLSLHDPQLRGVNSSQIEPRVQTDGDGAFVLTDIAEGQVLVFHRPSIFTSYSGIRELHPRQVVGGAGQQTIVAERTFGSVNVEVEVLRRGAPLSDCHVTHTLLMRAREEVPAAGSPYLVYREKMVHIQSSSVRLLGLSAGRWLFGAELSDGSVGTCTFSVADHGVGDVGATCDTGWTATLAGQVAGTEIPPEEFPYLSIAWVDASYGSGALGLPGWTHNIEQRWPVGGLARVKDDGSFEIEGMPPGEVVIQVRSLPRGFTSELKTVTVNASPAKNLVELVAVPAFVIDLAGIRASHAAELALAERGDNTTVALELRGEGEAITRWSGEPLVAMIQSDGALATVGTAPRTLQLVALSKTGASAPEILWTTSNGSPAARRWSPFE